MTEGKATMQLFKLDPECELRFELENKKEKVTLELKSGLAEVFGTELVEGKKYEFTCGAKIAVFTWQGCTVELIGKTSVSYVAKETAMSFYLNCHVAVERMRKLAERDNNPRGPIVMVVGPCNVGKFSLCKILSNYAVRMGRRPIYVDLDVDQGHITVPGTIGALLAERSFDVVDGFSQRAPLVYHFGHDRPSANSDLYDHLVNRLAEVCLNRLEVNKRTRFSGIVINTCGLIKEDYKSLTHAAQAFEVDAILVLDQERLYNDLVRDMPDFVKILLLPKSTGVVERTQSQRIEARKQSIGKYFYGSKTPLYPYSFEVNWSDVKLFKIGAPKLPSSSLPLGMKAEDYSTKLVPVKPLKKKYLMFSNLMNHMLSISFADSPEDDVVHTNVAGYVCITNVDVKREIFTVLSPQPSPLLNHILLLSEIQFADDTY